jgi:hypothetical protein
MVAVDRYDGESLAFVKAVLWNTNRCHAALCLSEKLYRYNFFQDFRAALPTIGRYRN